MECSMLWVYEVCQLMNEGWSGTFVYLSLFGLSRLLSLYVGSIFHWTPVLQLESLIGCLYTTDKERTNSEKTLKSLKGFWELHSCLILFSIFRHPYSISIGNEDYVCAKMERKHCAEHAFSFYVISFILNQLLQVIVYLSNEITEVKSCSVTWQGTNCQFRREVSLLRSGKSQYYQKWSKLLLTVGRWESLLWKMPYTLVTGQR